MTSLLIQQKWRALSNCFSQLGSGEDNDPRTEATDVLYAVPCKHCLEVYKVPRGHQMLTKNEHTDKP